MNLINQKNIFYCLFIFCIINSFFIFTPRFDYADQPLINAHLHKNLIDYQNEVRDTDFISYYNDKYKSYNKEKYKIEHYQGKYGIQDNPHFNRAVEKVKVTTRLLEFIPYKIFSGKIAIEKIFVFSNFLILFFTMIYFYKFGKIIISKEFGAILMILVVSNVYFNQLLRSSMQNEILIYPLLFSANFYYLFKIFIKKISYKTILLFSLFFALNFNNGYPNSTAILLPLIIFQFIFLYIFSGLNINNIKIFRPDLKSIFWLIASSIVIILVTSIFWSMQNGLDPFYLLSLAGTRLDRIYGSDGLAFATGSLLDAFNFYSIFDLFINFFKILIFPSHMYNAPHQPGFLLKIPYISVVEVFFFVLGIFYAFRKFSFNNYIKFFLLGLICLIILRSLTDRLWFVNKGNYDTFFLIHFFSAIGLYYFPFKFINSYIDEIKNIITYEKFKLYFYQNFKTRIILFFKYRLRSRINFLVPEQKFFKSTKSLNFSYFQYKVFIVFIILIFNSYNFNYKFVYKGNENLGLHAGLYQVKQFLDQNLHNERDLLIVNWQWSDVFYIDLISDIRSKYKIDILAKEIFTDKDYPYYYDKFDNIYFLQPGETFTVANRNFNTGGRSRIGNDLHKYFSFRNNKKIIRDREGKALYYITQISDIIHSEVDEKAVSAGKIDITLPNSYKFNYIDLPTYVDKLKITCDGQIYDFDFSRSNASYLHLNFVNNSLIEIYNDLSINNKSFKKDFNINYGNANDEAYSWQSNANYIYTKSGHDGNHGYIDFKHKFPLSLIDATITLPYMLFNDSNRNNTAEVFFKDKKVFQPVERIISDKTKKFGVSEWDPPANPFTSLNHSQIIDILSANYKFKSKNLKSFEYRLQLRRQLWGFTYGDRFISTTAQNFHHRPFNIIINANIEDKIKESIAKCNDTMTIEFEFNDLINNYKHQPFNYGLVKN